MLANLILTMKGKRVTQREVAARVGISGARFSDRLNGYGPPFSEAEKSAIAEFLATLPGPGFHDVALLFAEIELSSLGPAESALGRHRREAKAAGAAPETPEQAERRRQIAELQDRIDRSEEAFAEAINRAPLKR